MAGKRGLSGLSLVLGIDKPVGMSSHDVVNRCRRVFGERRVGHCGTLDPAASGVLVVCVGPATRLDAYLVGHDKRYRVRIAFGAATDTDDAEGEVIRRGQVPVEVYDEDFARTFCNGWVGKQRQMPPTYSAIKVGGKKACDEARAGRVMELEFRDIEIYDCNFVGLEESEDMVYWDVDLHVSSGTYVRSIARDMGIKLNCPAHVATLDRTSLGWLNKEDCVALEQLEEQGVKAALDPMRILGVRFAFARGRMSALMANGNPLPAQGVELFAYSRPSSGGAAYCDCSTGLVKTCAEPEDGEVIGVVESNKLRALYRFDAAKRVYRSACGFQIGVSRGECV